MFFRAEFSHHGKNRKTSIFYFKGEDIMTKLALENRIALLKGRQTDNGNIIKKLERKLRKLQKETAQND